MAEQMANDDVIAGVRERLGALLGSRPAGIRPERDNLTRPTAVEEPLAVELETLSDRSCAPEDWSHTLDAVHRAGDTLRAREERIRDLEAEVNRVTAEASEAIAALRAHVASLEEDLANADERRAHAEKWLVRLHDSIIERLTPNATPGGESSREAG